MNFFRFYIQPGLWDFEMFIDKENVHIPLQKCEIYSPKFPPILASTPASFGEHWEGSLIRRFLGIELSNCAVRPLQPMKRQTSVQRTLKPRNGFQDLYNMECVMCNMTCSFKWSLKEEEPGEDNLISCLKKNQPFKKRELTSMYFTPYVKLNPNGMETQCLKIKDRQVF